MVNKYRPTTCICIYTILPMCQEPNMLFLFFILNYIFIFLLKLWQWRKTIKIWSPFSLCNRKTRFSGEKCCFDLKGNDLFIVQHKVRKWQSLPLFCSLFVSINEYLSFRKQFLCKQCKQTNCNGVSSLWQRTNYNVLKMLESERL